MAKRASSKKKNGEQPKPGQGTGGFDYSYVRSYVDRIENCQSEIDEIMREARERCTPHREDLKVIYKEAADAGVPKTPLAAAVRKRRLEAKAEGVRDVLNVDQQDTFDRILHALGDLSDTPLGKAAISSAAEESRARDTLN